MATADVRTVLRIPSKLCANPTDLTGTFPYGGTALGLTARAAFRPKALYSPITAEEHGGLVVDGLYCGEQAMLTCFLRGWDSDAIATCFPNTSIGGVTGRRYIRYEPGVSGQNRAGYRLSNLAIKLFLSPEAGQYAPGVLIYSAVPQWDEGAEIALRDTQEATLPIVFLCLPSTAGRCYEFVWPKDANIT
jgi:hypothetical protein